MSLSLVLLLTCSHLVADVAASGKGGLGAALHASSSTGDTNAESDVRAPPSQRAEDNRRRRSKSTFGFGVKQGGSLIRPSTETKPSIDAQPVRLSLQAAVTEVMERRRASQSVHPSKLPQADAEDLSDSDDEELPPPVQLFPAQARRLRRHSCAPPVTRHDAQSVLRKLHLQSLARRLDRKSDKLMSFKSELVSVPETPERKPKAQRTERTMSCARSSRLPASAAGWLRLASTRRRRSNSMGVLKPGLAAMLSARARTRRRKRESGEKLNS